MFSQHNLILLVITNNIMITYFGIKLTIKICFTCKLFDTIHPVGCHDLIPGNKRKFSLDSPLILIRMITSQFGVICISLSRKPWSTRDLINVMPSCSFNLNQSKVNLNLVSHLIFDIWFVWYPWVTTHVQAHGWK